MKITFSSFISRCDEQLHIDLFLVANSRAFCLSSSETNNPNFSELISVSFTTKRRPASLPHSIRNGLLEPLPNLRSNILPTLIH